MKFLLLFLITFKVFAYAPTPESLFRNGANADVKATTSLVQFRLKKKIDTEESPTKIKNEDLFVKFVYFQDENSTYLTQIIYVDNFSRSNIVDVKYINTLNSDYFKNRNKLYSEGIFYGLMTSLILNKSDLIMNTFKSLGSNIKSNTESINAQKLDFINRYKEYLKLVNEDKDLKNSLENPLSPEDEEQKTLVKETMKQNFYQSEQDVKLIKKGKNLYWKIDKPMIDALFLSDSRELKNFVFNLEDKKFSFKLDNYILFNGVNVFPKRFIIKYLDNVYELHLEKLKHFSESFDVYRKRVPKYKSFQEKNLTKSPSHIADFII